MEPDPEEESPSPAANRSSYPPEGARELIIAHGASLFLILLGSAVLLGWALSLPLLTSVLSNLPHMAVTTACCFVLSGLSLRLQLDLQARQERQRVALFCAACVFVIAAGSLAGYAMRAYAPSLWADWIEGPAGYLPGQMAISTALIVLLLSLALRLLDWQTSGGARPAQYIALTAVGPTLLAVLGYSYQARVLGRSAFFTYMALHTSVGLGVLCIGILCARPHSGVVAALTTQGPGGRMARRLIVPALLLPFLLGWLRLIGQYAGLYDVEFGVALFAALNILALMSTIWFNAYSLRQADLQHRQAENALRESERRFRSLAIASAQIIWTTDAQGNYKSSRGWLAMTGQSEPDIQGRGWLEAIHPEDRERTAQAWSEAVERKTTYNREGRIRRFDGTYGHFSVRGVPVLNDQGEVQEWVGSCTDISQRKEVERLKDELVSTVSHELRTPLASLRGFAELMLQREFSEEKRREFLGIINKESKRLTRLINNFLDLQRMESSTQVCHFETIEVEPLLCEALASFGAVPGHILELKLSQGLPRARADADRLRQVVANLLSNAVKYSPQGGTVTLGARQEGGEVLVWVTDQGLGIPAEVLPKLFTKFHRVEGAAHRSIGGTGLGLALCKQIVQLHRGRIWVESEEGKGSRFLFTVPVAETVPRPAPERLCGARCTDILLVEDDPSFANLLREHFEGFGLSVATAASAEEGLRLVRSRSPRLVLLDIYLSGELSGWDLLAAIKSDWLLQHIPVILVTIAEPNLRGLALGGAEYLPKAASPEILMMSIRRRLSQGSGKRVLLADDDPEFRRVLASTLLAEDGLAVEEAANGKEVLAALNRQMPDLLILDLLMPVMDGFEVLRKLRESGRTVNLEVLVVSAKDLSSEERKYIQGKLASLVGKKEADLNYITEVVEKTLGTKFTTAVAARP